MNRNGNGTMIFFGWGRTSKTAQLDGGTALVRAWSYFHLFWLFRISWGGRYSLATATEAGWATRELAPDETARLSDDVKQSVAINWWWRWGLLIGIGALVTFAMIMSLTAG